MKKNYIKPAMYMVELHTGNLMSLSVNTSSTTYDGDAGAKEIEINNPNLWDNSKKMWAMEDEEEK